MDINSKIFIAGSEKLIAGALMRKIAKKGYSNLLTAKDLDLTDQDQVNNFFKTNRPEYVFLSGGSSAGILANQRYPADLMAQNLVTQTNIICGAHEYKVNKLLFLASSCTYPRNCPQPMDTTDLLTGPLETTNEAYAIAKIAGIKLCQAYYSQFKDKFITAIPSNPFGIDDDFSSENSHVIGALISKMHQAKLDLQESVTIWGSGSPRRDFIFADDLADACVFIMNRYELNEPINLGTKHDISISELAELIKETVGYAGTIEYDTEKPDGMPYKSLSCEKLSDLGWKPQTKLTDALSKTYASFLQSGEVK